MVAIPTDMTHGVTLPLWYILGASAQYLAAAF